MDSPITDEMQATLLRLAREALRLTAEGRELPTIDLNNLPAPLREPGASFITLTKDEALRGCIGTLEAKLPLAEDVRQHTLAAALYDYRFPKVQPDEVDEIKIEVSILTEPKQLEYKDPEDLLQLLRPEIDGVILTDGVRRATFLPQVWKRIPSPTLFLSMLCEKASLAPDAWRKENLQVFVYQVMEIHEK